MFRGLASYREESDTSLSWAPKVPSHWRVARAKTVMSAVDERSVTGAEELLTVSSSRGVIPRSSTSVSMFMAASYAGHKLCWPDDLVINSLWAWGRGLGVARHHGIVSTAYGVYRQRRPELLPEYLNHLVRSTPFQWELQVRSQGVWKSRLQMTDARWLDAPLLVPPQEEQAAIVKYLAHANARIDKAIAAKRRLIALLDEQRLATAAQLISDVEGDRMRLKNVASLQTGLTLGKDYGDKDLYEYPYLRVANVQMGHVNIEDVATVRVPAEEAARCTLRLGDVLMTEGGDIDKLGRGTVWDGAIDGCLHQNHVFAVRCQDRLLPEYLAAWLAAPEPRWYFYVTAKRTTNLAATNSTTVRGLPMVVPPLHEQQAALARVAEATAPVASAVARSEREIQILREFRTRLVADAVTGQVDVREIAGKLPDVAPAAAWGDTGIGDETDLAELDDVLVNSES